MTSLILAPSQNTEQQSTINVPPVEAATASDRGARVSAPLFIPRDQVYYWTREWQAAESQAVADIAAGRVYRFASGAEATAWLLSVEG